MDYYEELGIEASASEEEIHRAHRRLTKLLHPDQQTDQEMKLLAETQMRRLNAIVETLSDPEQRREYDYLLNGDPPLPVPLFVRSRPAPASRRPRPIWHSWSWWIGSTIGAVVLSVGAVWFWADNLGSSFGDRSPAYIPLQVDGAKDSKAAAPGSKPSLSQDSRGAFSRLRDALSPSRPGSKPIQAAGTDRADGGNTKNQAPRSPQPEKVVSNGASEQTFVAVRSSSIETRPAAPVAMQRPSISPPPQLPANSLTHPDAPSIPLPALPAAAPKPIETASAAKPSGPAPAPRPSVPVASSAPATVPRDPLEGEWVYAPKEPEKRKPGLYPPEFIDLKLFWNEGALHGQYRARYEVTDKPISPDVSFVLAAADKNSHRFMWQSSNGSRGTLKISSIDPTSIKIEWRTTVFTTGPALTAGTATLVRRSPPSEIP